SELDSASLRVGSGQSVGLRRSLQSMVKQRVKDSHRTLRGDWRQRVGIDQPRNLGGPQFVFCGRRTAHSSEEAGNDRGAKGLNVNVQLEEEERTAGMKIPLRNRRNSK